MNPLVNALWSYHGFAAGSVKREFQSNYRNSLLGAARTLLNPLAMIVVHAVLLSQVMKAKLPGVDSTFAYSIYLYAGLLTWGLFAEIVGRAQNNFLDQANLMKKLSFPRVTLPVIVVQQARDGGRVETISGTGDATVADIALLNDEGERIEVVDVGVPVTLRVKVAVHGPIPRLVIGYMIKDRLGQPMFGTNTHLRELPLVDVRAGEQIDYRFALPANLGPGTYSIAAALVSTDAHLVNTYESRDLALVFHVVNQTRTQFVGYTWIESAIEIARQ